MGSGPKTCSDITRRKNTPDSLLGSHGSDSFRNSPGLWQVQEWYADSYGSPYQKPWHLLPGRIILEQLTYQGCDGAVVSGYLVGIMISKFVFGQRKRAHLVHSGQRGAVIMQWHAMYPVGWHDI